MMPAFYFTTKWAEKSFYLLSLFAFLFILPYFITGLTDQEVLINSMMFMVAGYDTTATTLCWLTYDLATNPDVQEKLIEEIDSEIGQVLVM